MSSRTFVRLTGGLAVVSSLVACSSDDGGPTGPGTGGSGTLGGSGTVAGSGGVPSAGTGGSVATGGGGTGAGAGGSGGSAGATAGSGGAAGGSGGAAGGSGGGAAVACPADKTFCAGFEDATLPEGAVYEYQAADGPWTRDFQIDTTVFKSGKSSVKLVNPGSGSQLRMLRVPAPPGGKFWARFYIRQAGADIGDVKHHVFAGASWTTDANTKMIEFAEDVGVAINANDVVRWPMGFGRLNDGSTKPFTLAKDQWHCIELSFDGVARVQQVYVEGELKIDATDFPAMVPMPLAYFRFGFQALNGRVAELWYDDVAVGPTRPGCLPK